MTTTARSRAPIQPCRRFPAQPGAAAARPSWSIPAVGFTPSWPIPILQALVFLLGSVLAVRADDWPQWLGPQRDGVWRETGIARKFPTNGPPIRWRAPVGAGYSGPAVAEGRVFLTDRQLAPKSSNPSNPFDKARIAGNERVLCLNESDGRLLWKHEYDCPYDVSYPAGPRTTPLIDQGKVYTLGTEGHLLCLEVKSGRVLWSRDFKKEFGVSTPLWGFSAHPLLEGNRLICMVGGEGSTVVAFDKETGQEIWRALTAKEPGYCPPTMIEAGGRRQLLIWHPESIQALDPATGRLLWSQPYTARFGLTISTPRQRGDQLFLTSFYNGPILLRLAADPPGASVVWKGKSQSERNTDGLHSIMSTPFFEGDWIYGVCSYGQLRCLKAATGERVWETLAATGGKETRWANAFLIKNGDLFFLANEQGDLIIARLSPERYEELSRAHLLEPTNSAAGRDVVWSHPAFANRSIYARNDREIVCASLAETRPPN